MTVRPVDWKRDAEGIVRIDTSFTTDRVYRFAERGAASDSRCHS